MTLKIDQLKNKIIYRSSYRGTKEMDILLRDFVNHIINKLNKDELEKLLLFLNIDDETLYKFKQGKKTNIKVEENKISNIFKNFLQKK